MQLNDNLIQRIILSLLDEMPEMRARAIVLAALREMPEQRAEAIFDEWRRSTKRWQEEQLKRLEAVKLLPIDELEMSTRAYNACLNHDIKTIGDLAAVPKSEMMEWPNIGRRTLNEIEEVLDSIGLKMPA